MLSDNNMLAPEDNLVYHLCIEQWYFSCDPNTLSFALSCLLGITLRRVLLQATGIPAQQDAVIPHIN